MSLREITRESVLKAITEFDHVSRDRFLAKYHFGKAREYFLIHNGKPYDSKAIAGAAHGFAFPHHSPLRPTQFSGGEKTVASTLRQLGFEVRRAKAGRLAPNSHRPAAWIFQGNPDRFDVDAYLGRSPDIYWTVTRHVHQQAIAVGDSVFVWRAAGRRRLDAGVVAVGRVIEPCRPRKQLVHPDWLFDELWTTNGVEPSEVKAGVHIDEFRLTPAGGMLSRALIGTDQQLASMAIIRTRTGSNFPLDPSQTRRLLELWTIAREESEEGLPGTRLSAAEGRVMLRLHRIRERDPKLVAEAKRRFAKAHGDLFCQCCGFSFGKRYGALGQGYIEAHHTKPLASMRPGEETSVADLMMVCSNCHCVIHRNDPARTPDELRAMFQRTDEEVS